MAADPTATGDAAAIDPVTGQPVAAGPAADLTKGGWVIQLVGFHLHNRLRDPPVDVGYESERFIINTFFKNLEQGTVQLPDGPNGELKEVRIADLGILYPTIVTARRVQDVTYLAESAEAAQQRINAFNRPDIEGRQPAVGANAAEPPEPKKFKLRQYDFYIQFCWLQHSRSEREAKTVPSAEAEPGTASVDDPAATSGT
jgi:hypothetical protein